MLKLKKKTNHPYLFMCLTWSWIMASCEMNKEQRLRESTTCTCICVIVPPYTFTYRLYSHIIRTHNPSQIFKTCCPLTYIIFLPFVYMLHPFFRLINWLQKCDLCVICSQGATLMVALLPGASWKSIQASRFYELLAWRASSFSGLDTWYSVYFLHFLFYKWFLPSSLLWT